MFSVVYLPPLKLRYKNPFLFDEVSIRFVHDRGALPLLRNLSGSEARLGGSENRDY
jgi:hypothetical protein